MHFDDIYKSYSAKVAQKLRWKYKIPAGDVSDLVQDIFIELSQIPEISVADKLFVAGRLKMLTLNRMGRYWKERERDIRSTEMYHEMTSADEIFTKYSEQTLLAVLDLLEPSYRDVLKLYYLEDRTYGEIATKLKIRVLTVRQRISRGLKKLKASRREVAKLLESM